MPEQLSNDWKAETTACANARICVAEVVDTDAVQPRALRNGLPGSFEVGTRLFGIVPGDDVGACPGQTRKHFQGRGVQHDGFFAGLAVSEQEQPAIKVDVLPPEMQDFPQASPREQQQAQSGGGMGTDLGAPLLRPGRVFRLRLGPVHLVWNADCLGLANRLTQAHQLIYGQEPLSALLRVLVNPAGRVDAECEDVPPAGEAV